MLTIYQHFNCSYVAIDNYTNAELLPPRMASIGQSVTEEEVGIQFSAHQALSVECVSSLGGVYIGIRSASARFSSVGCKFASKALTMVRFHTPVAAC